jgi:hypothetical protein
MAAVADHKKIKLGTADVRIDYQLHPGKEWLTSFDVRIDLGNGLTSREKRILFNTARLCEVTKLLSGEKKFTYELTGDI